MLPTTTVGQLGPVAGWISTSGWAAAAERQLGQAWIVTRHGVLSVAEVRRRAADRPTPAAPSRRRWTHLVPPVVKTAAKDLREAQRARAFRVDPAGPWTGEAVDFVWQRHELFHRAGLDLARALAVPSVLFVPALTVQQAEQWSVRRPGWGRWLEQHAEAPALRAATLVACGSDIVAEQVGRLGVPEDRRLVTPTGVDLALFEATGDRAAARAELGLEGRFVVGWAGSFRPFHQLDQLVHAAREVPDVVLLLVGDGPERPRLERLVREAGVVARFTGMVPHDDLPRLLSAMDAGVVLAQAGAPFHYSPLKAAEYLAAGVPVVAPAVPQLLARLEEGRNAVFYGAGDVQALSAALRALADDAPRRERLADGARGSAPAWSWDRQVERVTAALAVVR